MPLVPGIHLQSSTHRVASGVCNVLIPPASPAVMYWPLDGSPVYLPAVAMSSLTVNPSSLTIGQTATITITLTGPAPPTGAWVTLTSSNSAAFPVPDSYFIQAGQSVGILAVVAGTVSSSTSATVTAAYNNSVRTATVTVNPPLPTITSLAISESIRSEGQTATVTITLSGPAPQGGAAVGDEH